MLLPSPTLGGVDSRKLLQDSLLLLGKESFEAVRFHDLLPLLRIHLAKVPQGFVYGDSALLRKPLELMIGVTQFLALRRCQTGPEAHPLQRQSALIRRQAVEFAEPVAQRRLAGGRKLFEIGIAFKSFFLLVKRKILVGFKPLEQGLRGAALVSFLNCVPFRGCRLQHNSPLRYGKIPVYRGQCGSAGQSRRRGQQSRDDICPVHRLVSPEQQLFSKSLCRPPGLAQSRHPAMAGRPFH